MDFADKVLADLTTRIRDLERQIESHVAERRAWFGYVVERNRVRFGFHIREKHRGFRLGLWTQISQSPLRFILVAPLIYSLIVPLALLDLFLVVYQAICFRVYGISRVPRDDFIVIDRHYLTYLNPLEKLNCIYCGYANGLIAYAREIGARTEEYWCPIKHSRPIAKPHSRYVNFADYGDAEGYRQRQEDLRRHACEPDEPPSAV